MLSNAQHEQPSNNTITLRIERRPEATQLKELPSTSEMVSIAVPHTKSIEKPPGPSLLQCSGTRTSTAEISVLGIGSQEDTLPSLCAQNPSPSSSNLTESEYEETHRGHGPARAMHEEPAIPWLNATQASTDQSAGEGYYPQPQPRLQEPKRDSIRPPQREQNHNECLCLSSTVLDMEKREAETHQLITQKGAEISSLQIKCLSLQDANENYQEQTKKAIEEKERVQRDYLQVVYDLGKAQKQLNAVSKEAASNTEKEFLLREIDQLHRDNVQLQQKLKEAESRRTLGMPASQDSQQVASLQKHIQELGDEVRRLHFSGSAAAPPPPVCPFLNNSMGTKNSINQPLVNQNVGPSRDRSSTNLFSMDLAAARREQPSYKDKNRQRVATLLQTADQAFNSRWILNNSKLRVKLLNLALHFCSMLNSNVSDLLHQMPSRNDIPGLASSQSRSALFPPVDTASLAPFATERQSFQLDAMEKRHLEQKLMNLQLEKDQMEAKVTKLEQTGLKTMSARSEKQWLDSRLRDLTQEISRLKLTLR
ncbi:hypothetical protein FI667_g4419, partial [Globisporangium splendens]